MSGYNGTSTRNHTAEQLRALAQAAVAEAHTTAVGTIVDYDSKRQKGTVQLSLKRKVGDKVVTAPQLLEVPISFNRGGGFITHKKMKAGDEVIVNFSQRSMDDAIESGGDMDQAFGRMNDLSDAIATPAAFSKGKELADMPDGFFSGSEDGKKGLSVGEDGTASLKGGPDGNSKVSINPSNGKVNMTANGENLAQLLKEAIEMFRDHKNGSTGIDAGDVTKANALLTRLSSFGDI